MSKKIFSEKEINELSKNKYVKKVSQKGITYTNEFKLHFIAEYALAIDGENHIRKKVFLV